MGKDPAMKGLEQQGCLDSSPMPCHSAEAGACYFLSILPYKHDSIMTVSVKDSNNRILKGFGKEIKFFDKNKISL